jgi:HD-GYP domain-containing protein (c-di-GMP phosphodiesterase class II)
LAGENIPLLARVLAVANTYDSLRTGSPGRPGLSEQEATQELRRAAGNELDPEMVPVFLRALGYDSPARRAPRPAKAPPDGS